jgi:hypothetical protein
MSFNEEKAIINKGKKKFSDGQISDILRLFDLLAIINIQQFLKK